ncbi:MAG: HAD hydrolase-like protein, partial [Eubacterium sp.]
RYQMEQGIFESSPYDGMISLLAMLKESNHKLGVATLKRQDITELTLSSAGISNYFDAVFGIDMAESFTKSDIINLALKEMQILPKDAVMIGDSPYDALGAKECGVDFIGVDYGFGFKDVDEIKSFHPVYTALFPDDLISFFDHC